MDEEAKTPSKDGFSASQVALFVLIAILITAGTCYWFFKTFISPSNFEPVALSSKEQVQLDSKLQQLGINPRDLFSRTESENQFDSEGRLVPKEYVENPEKRNIQMSERELNAIVASNSDIAKRLAIDLSDDLASAKLLIPVDPDFPMLGGKTLRVNAGLEIAYRNELPVVILRGVSIMGVPIPNAWLGNLKNVDLVEQFGTDPGFWSSFSDGVDLIEIDDGQLHIKLRE